MKHLKTDHRADEAIEQMAKSIQGMKPRTCGRESWEAHKRANRRIKYIFIAAVSFALLLTFLALAINIWSAHSERMDVLRGSELVARFINE